MQNQSKQVISFQNFEKRDSYLTSYAGEIRLKHEERKKNKWSQNDKIDRKRVLINVNSFLYLSGRHFLLNTHVC